uniref:G-protein alpha subunit n=2 Tax=Globodera pallida TaxID=36090 RepID=A0A183C9L9_GLOPA
MGLCESQETKAMIARSKEIDKQLHLDFMAQKKVVKLLLLGSAEAGKTTMVKQMKIMHANGFCEDERLEFKEYVYSNIIDGMFMLLNAMKQMNIAFDNPNLEIYADKVLEMKERHEERRPFDLKMVEALRALWTDKNLTEKVLSRRNEFHFVESSIYFLDSLDRVSAIDYVPTVQDILNLRIETTEIVNYEIRGVNFCVFDVGGCRSERRKWIHCFDHVQSIIFLSAISEFDQKSRETPSVNRLVESMRIFSTICNSRWFIRTGFILFLNKRDLFEQKIRQGKSISACFKNYFEKTNLPKTLVAVIKLMVCLMFIQILARSDEVDAGKARFASSDRDEPVVDDANSCTIRVQKVEKFQGKCIALKDGVTACQTSKYLDPSNADCSVFP